MKKTITLLLLITCLTIGFAQSIYNSAQIGQTGRNQNVSRGFWVKSDTALFTSLFWLPANAGAGKVLTSDANGFGTWTAISAGAWALTGNGSTVAGTNFIGTTDAVDFVAKTSNTEALRIDAAGNVVINNNTAKAKFHVKGVNSSRYSFLVGDSPTVAGAKTFIYNDASFGIPQWRSGFLGNLTAIGLGNGTNWWDADSLGVGNFVYGTNNKATGLSSTVIGGYNNYARDTNCVILGGTQNVGRTRTVILNGNQCTANGYNSFIAVSNKCMVGINMGYSTVFGAYQSYVNSIHGTIIGGAWDSIYSYHETVIGNSAIKDITGTPASWVKADLLFHIGNSFDSLEKQNSLIMIKNGNTVLGDSLGLADKPLPISPMLRVKGDVKIDSILQLPYGAGAGKVLEGDGSGFASWTGAVYGSYYDTTNQVNNSTTAAIYSKCNITLEQSGITKTNDSTFTIGQTGVYQFFFLSQVTKTDGGVDNIRFWLRVNGSDLPFSSGDITLSTTNSSHVVTWLYTQTFTAADAINLMWQSDDPDMLLQTVARGTTPNTPASPAMVITINKIK